MRFLFHAESYSSAMVNLSLLILRLSFGLSMAFAHGLSKVPPNSQFIGYLSSLGTPLPELMAWLAGLSELVGGFAIALGLATRPFALTWIGTMGVAVFVAHANDPFQKMELGLAYLTVAVVLFLCGAGRYSIDGLISKK